MSARRGAMSFQRKVGNRGLETVNEALVTNLASCCGRSASDPYDQVIRRGNANEIPREQ